MAHGGVNEEQGQRVTVNFQAGRQSPWWFSDKELRAKPAAHAVRNTTRARTAITVPGRRRFRRCLPRADARFQKRICLDTPDKRRRVCPTLPLHAEKVNPKNLSFNFSYSATRSRKPKERRREVPASFHCVRLRFRQWNSAARAAPNAGQDSTDGRDGAASRPKERTGPAGPHTTQRIPGHP